MPFFTRYISALRFQRMMLPRSPPAVGIWLRKCSGCVPPMLLKSTTCLTPARAAASMTALLPCQSIRSGSAPAGYAKAGGAPAFCSVHLTPAACLLGFGVALWRMTTVSTPPSAPSTDSGSWTSQTRHSAPVLARTAAAEASLRAVPTASKRSLLPAIFLRTMEPVLPPAPVTSTRVGLGPAAGAAGEKAMESTRSCMQGGEKMVPPAPAAAAAIHCHLPPSETWPGSSSTVSVAGSMTRQVLPPLGGQ
mmetsp:Transcript_17517/g.56092  ORF Transcript_17517/g.56092 Transcript_17517/m.56092 type:complete len:249 (+) Transcript_17517:652-1398(+)